MSSEECEGKDPLKSLITRYLEAENRGLNLDRDALIEDHPDLADSLREFFANHDRMKVAANLEDPTLPPNESRLDDFTMRPGQDAHEEATIPPRPTGEDPALPPTEAASRHADASVGDQVRYFGDYELLEEIARGGMGVVFKARQINLHRTVALKMILAGQFASREDVQRFHIEAKAAAQLDHPGIVPIFEIGEHARQHYFSMGFIEGESLAHKVADGPLPPREAAELVRKICEAMAYAHKQGVIHRDLKPANILIDRDGQPKVTDFGLAKRTEADSKLTYTGQIIGTPAYMSPEQASGNIDEIGPLTDIYALGAILYRILTGRPPFLAASPTDTLLQVLNQEPVPLRTLNPQVPQDLETICLKCLSKDSTRRYPSASELKEELSRYIEGKPISARSVGQLERGWRWCQRNPIVASLIAAVVLLLLTGTTVSTVFGVIAEKRAIETHNALLAVSAEKARADANTEVAKRNLVISQEEKRRADVKTEEARQQRDEAKRQEDRARRQLYANHISSSQRGFASKDAADAWNQLASCQTDLRGWEHNYLYTKFTQRSIVLLGHRDDVLSVAFSPDGLQIASGSSDKSVRVWDATTGEERLILKGHIRDVTCVVFSSDGARIVSGSRDGTIILWNAQDGTRLKSIKVTNGRGRLETLAISPDNTRIASGSYESPTRGRAGSSVVKLWNAKNGKEVFALEGIETGVRSVAFSPDGSQILIPSGTAAKVRDAERGAFVLSLEGADDSFYGTNCLAFSPDGSMITGTKLSEIKVWDAHTGKERLSLQGHKWLVQGVAFSPDGKTIASCSDDQTIRIWDAMTGNEISSFQGHNHEVKSVTFSPDGSRIASGSRDHTIRVWDVDGNQEIGVLHPPRVFSSNYATVSSDGSRIAYLRDSGGVSVWSSRTGEELFFYDYDLPSATYAIVAFSPDGSRIALGLPDKTLILDTQNGRVISSFSPGCKRDIAFSPDGSKIASAPDSATIKVWDVMTGEDILTLDTVLESHLCLALAFSPDGCQLVTGSGWGLIEVWDAQTGRKLLTRGVYAEISDLNPKTMVANASVRNTVSLVAYSPDGSRILGGTVGGTLKVWDAKTGSELLDLVGHTQGVSDAAFSPDGKRIASSSTDQTIRVWDARSGKQTIALKAEGPSSGVAFSRDGSSIIGVSSNAIVNVWDASRRMPDYLLPGYAMDRLEHARAARNVNTETSISTAIQLYRSVVDAFPVAQAHYGLAVALHSSEKLDDAKVEYKAALHLLSDQLGDTPVKLSDSPYGDGISVALVYLKLAGLERDREGREAQRTVHATLIDVLEENPEPDKVAYWEFLGESLYRVGRIEESRAAIEKSIQMRGDTGPTISGGPRWWYLVMALHQTGDTKLARQHFEVLASQMSSKSPDSLKSCQAEAAELMGIRDSMRDKETNSSNHKSGTTEPTPPKVESNSITGSRSVTRVPGLISNEGKKATTSTAAVASSINNVPGDQMPIAAEMPNNSVTNWGRVVDPDDDCFFHIDDRTMEIQVPNTPHGLSIEINRMNAPRVVQEAEGNFTMNVTVTGDFAPGAATVPGRSSYQGAGLLLMQDENTYIRLERAVLERNGQHRHYANFELRRDGKMMRFGSPNDFTIDANAPCQLRLEREGNEIRGAVRQGNHWHYVKPKQAEFDQRVSVGIVAVNASGSVFKPRFSDLEIRDLSKGKVPR